MPNSCSYPLEFHCLREFSLTITMIHRFAEVFVPKRSKGFGNLAVDDTLSDSGKIRVSASAVADLACHVPVKMKLSYAKCLQRLLRISKKFVSGDRILTCNHHDTPFRRRIGGKAKPSFWQPVHDTLSTSRQMCFFRDGLSLTVPVMTLTKRNY